MTDKIKQTRFPHHALKFKYGDNKKVTWNLRALLRARARKLCKDLYYKKIDCGPHTGELRGKTVPVDTLGRFLFGLKGWKATTLVVPYYTHLEVLMYTDDVVANRLVICAAEGIDMKFDGIKFYETGGNNE